MSNRKLIKLRRKPGPNIRSGNDLKGKMNVWDALDIVKRDAKQGIKRLTNIVNAELKVAATGFSSQAVSSTATIEEVVEIALGDNYNERDGRSVLVDHLHVRIGCLLHASATRSQLRFIFVRSLSGVAPTATDLLTSTAAGTSVWSNKNFNLYTLKEFSVFHDELVMLNTYNPAGYLTFDIPWHKHIAYTGDGVNDTSVGAIYMLVVSNEATNTPTIAGNVIARFYDN